MVNSGPHSNGSQFYMTLDALSWMDGKAVAFGYVVDGMRVLRVLEKAACSESEAPLTPITIRQCGVYTV
jgi:cyclophilin family peptidyl-prolyl cis-trans isomerase